MRLEDCRSRSGIATETDKKLNALEYHRSSEINIAVNDLVLLLGAEQDIQADYTYDTSLVGSSSFRRER